MALKLVVFDVGETLIDETGMWERAADAAAVPADLREIRNEGAEIVEIAVRPLDDLLLGQRLLRLEGRRGDDRGGDDRLLGGRGGG